MTTLTQIDLIKEVVERNRAAGIAIVYPPEIPTLPPSTFMYMSNWPVPTKPFALSNDLETWSAPTPPSASILLDFYFDDAGSGLVGIGVPFGTGFSFQAIVVYKNGVTTEPFNTSDGTFFSLSAFTSVAYNGTTAVVVGIDGDGFTAVAYYSNDADLAVWTKVAVGGTSGNGLAGVRWIPDLGLFIAHGDGIWTSPDGITWTNRLSVSALKWISTLVYNGTTLYASYSGSATADVHSSTDGTTWTLHTTTAFPAYVTSPNSIIWDEGLGLWIAASALVYTSAALGIVTSPDFVNWTLRYNSASPVETFSHVIKLGSIFYAMGERGAPGSRLALIASSTDAITWTPSIPPIFNTPGSETFFSSSGNPAPDIVIGPDGTSMAVEVFRAVDGIGSNWLTSDGVNFTRLDAADAPLFWGAIKRHPAIRFIA